MRNYFGASNGMNWYILKVYLLWFAFFGLVFGIYTEFFFSAGYSIGFLLLAVALSFFVALFLIRNPDIKTPIILIGFFLLFFSIGIIRYVYVTPKQNYLLENNINNKVVLSGVVSGDSVVGARSQQVVIRVWSIDGEEDKRGTKVLIFTENFPKYEHKDNIQVRGVIKKVENFETETNRQFDYISFLKKDGILYTISFPEIEISVEGEGLKRNLFGLKNKFIENLKVVLPEPESSLLSGMLLGDDSGLLPEDDQIFRKSGLTHIVVLSGYNITIISENLGKILLMLPKALNYSLSGVVIVIFVLMVSAGPASLRALVMALLLLFARSLHRDYLASRALAFALLSMLVYNPLSLVFDPGFALSALATAGLVYFSPTIENLFKKIKPAVLKEAVVSTIAAQFFVLPFLIYKMGEISVFGTLANILVLPVIPIPMFVGFLASIVGILSIILSTPFSFISYLVLKYIFVVAGFFANLPSSTILIPEFSNWLLVFLYLPHIYIVYLVHNRARRDLKNNTGVS